MSHESRIKGKSKKCRFLFTFLVFHIFCNKDFFCDKDGCFIIMPLEGQQESQSAAIALLKTRLGGFETEEGRLKGLSYIPKYPSEVAITTTPKAGTTWLQQICHQLRAAKDGGDMSFSEIGEVVPWLELAHDQGQDLYGPQYGHEQHLPRFFKTHAWEEHCPNFEKVIVVLRNPEDVLLSFFRFFEGWFFEVGSITLDEFAKEFWLARGVPTSKMQNPSYFIHLISWYKRRTDPNVLLVCFEDLVKDLEGQITRIAKFVSTDKHDFTSSEIIKAVTEKSTYTYMKQHESQFDEKLSKLARNEACGLPKDSGIQKSKVGSGVCGKGASELSDDLREQIWKKWKEVVEPETGCSTYQELLEHLRKELE